MLTHKLLLNAAHATGASATRAVHAVLYGSRYTPNTNAGTAKPVTAAAGIPLRSVWDGQKQKRGGAPIVRRAKIVG